MSIQAGGIDFFKQLDDERVAQEGQREPGSTVETTIDPAEQSPVTTGVTVGMGVEAAFLAACDQPRPAVVSDVSAPVAGFVMPHVPLPSMGGSVLQFLRGAFDDAHSPSPGSPQEGDDGGDDSADVVPFTARDRPRRHVSGFDAAAAGASGTATCDNAEEAAAAELSVSSMEGRSVSSFGATLIGSEAPQSPRPTAAQSASVARLRGRTFAHRVGTQEPSPTSAAADNRLLSVPPVQIPAGALAEVFRSVQVAPTVAEDTTLQPKPIHGKKLNLVHVAGAPPPELPKLPAALDMPLRMRCAFCIKFDSVCSTCYKKWRTQELPVRKAALQTRLTEQPDVVRIVQLFVTCARGDTQFLEAIMSAQPDCVRRMAELVPLRVDADPADFLAADSGADFAFARMTESASPARGGDAAPANGAASSGPPLSPTAMVGGDQPTAAGGGLSFAHDRGSFIELQAARASGSAVDVAGLLSSQGPSSPLISGSFTALNASIAVTEAAAMAAAGVGVNADVLKYWRPRPLSLRCCGRHSLLHVAVCYDRPEVAKLLFERGAVPQRSAAKLLPTAFIPALPEAAAAAAAAREAEGGSRHEGDWGRLVEWHDLMAAVPAVQEAHIIEEARRRRQRGDAAGALRLYDDVLMRNPRNEHALLARPKTYYDMGDYRQCVRLCGEVLALHADGGVAWADFTPQTVRSLEQSALQDWHKRAHGVRGPVLRDCGCVVLSNVRMSLRGMTRAVFAQHVVPFLGCREALALHRAISEGSQTAETRAAAGAAAAATSAQGGPLRFIESESVGLSPARKALMQRTWGPVDVLLKGVVQQLPRTQLTDALYGDSVIFPVLNRLRTEVPPLSAVFTGAKGAADTAPRYGAPFTMRGFSVVSFADFDAFVVRVVVEATATAATEPKAEKKKGFFASLFNKDSPAGDASLPKGAIPAALSKQFVVSRRDPSCPWEIHAAGEWEMDGHLRIASVA